MVSLGILTGLLVLALTSTRFNVTNGSVALPVAAFTPWPAATPAVMAAGATPLKEPGFLVYYVVDSQTQRNEIEMAVQSDINDDSLRGFAPLHRTARAFLLVQDARDEAEVLEFLRHLVISPPIDGTNVRVIDLR
jgi:hypothetical protein